MYFDTQKTIVYVPFIQFVRNMVIYRAVFLFRQKGDTFYNIRYKIRSSYHRF